MPRRRDFLKVAAGGAALLATGCHKRRSAPPTKAAPSGRAPLPPGSKPRYFVQLLLSGGHDTVYTTDPKTRSEVQAGIDLPADNKIAEAAALRLGPNFAPLARWGHRIALVNGVQVGTANHDTGLKQFFRLKTNVDARMPTAFDLIGQERERDGQPLGAVYLNITNRVLHSPGYFGYPDRFYYGQHTLFDAAAEARPGDLERLARVMRTQADSLRRRGASSREALATMAHLRQAGAFFDRVAHVPKFEAVQVSTDYTSQSMAQSLQRATWLIENDLTRCILVDVGLLGWDTHQRNAARQTEITGEFVHHLDWFLDQLSRRKNAHGILADQTLIVGGSDLGRFPRLNDMLGKDHLPQTAYFFVGPGVQGGHVFGQTGHEMEGVPVSVTTGRPPAKGAGRMLVLDDIGTTVLHIAGLAPERHGYTGQVLEFLLS